MARREVLDCDFGPEEAGFTIQLTDVNTGESWLADACEKHRMTATLAKVREKGRPAKESTHPSLKDTSLRALAGRIRD